MSTFTRPLARRQFVAVVTIFLIRALLVPAPVVAAYAGNRERKGVRPAPAPTKAEREAKVARLELNVAPEIELKSRQLLQLSAIPLDTDGNAIQGLSAQWESSAKDVVFVRKNGEAVAGKTGAATLIAVAGNKQATIHVRVVEGTKEPFGGKKRIDSRRNAPVAQNRRRPKRAHVVTPFMRDPNDDPLPDNETSSLYQPNNLIGTPPGKTKPGALSAAASIAVTESGNRNFTFGLPVVGLPGRGIDVSLALIDNSLVCNKSTNPSDGSTWMTYDVDSGYPAQGFRLGYGQIEDQGSAGFTLTDSNGTRHALAYSSAYNYDTTDGTFIHFNGGSGWGTLSYPDGTRVGYGAAGNGYRSYPTSITDRNGNYILISYVNGVGPRISTIQDTVGRYVRFYYDSNNELVTIMMPGLTGQSDLQVMRFYYETLTLPSGLFASGISVDKPASARVIRYVYLPASGEGSSGDIGYRFDYSAYAMIYQIVKFHGMTASTTSTSSAGTVTEGVNTIAATTTYDYYTSASGISDVPTFAHRTDEWAGRTGGGSAPQYTFSVSEQTSETISTVTSPGSNPTIMETHTIKNSGAWNDGLVSETRIQNASSVIFRKTVLTWAQNSSNATPRLASVRVTNEAGKTTATVFSYDDAHTPYNNISVVSERDFTTDGSVSSTELRRTETTYVTSSNYLNRQLLHLPSMLKVFPGGSSTPASRVDFTYDDYGASHANLTARDDIIMHDVAFDPFQQTQENCDWVCSEWGYPDPDSPYQCLNWQWGCTYYNPYDSGTDYRGNVTSVTTYPGATTTTGAITHATTYDIAGNVITAIRRNT